MSETKKASDTLITPTEDVIQEFNDLSAQFDQIKVTQEYLAQQLKEIQQGLQRLSIAIGAEPSSAIVAATAKLEEGDRVRIKNPSPGQPSLGTYRGPSKGAYYHRIELSDGSIIKRIRKNIIPLQE